MRKILAVLFFFLITLSLPTLVLAQENRSTSILPKDQTVDRSYFSSGSQVILSGTVNGDAYLMGGNILVDGTVNGDLLAVGGTIDMRGNVTGNIRTVGGQTTVSGEVGRNISIAGGSVNISPSGRINGDLVTAAGQIAIDPTAKVSGQITQYQPTPDKKATNLFGLFAGVNFFLALISFVSYLVLGLILFSLFPIFGQKTSEILMKKPWVSLGIGLLIALLVPVLILFLLVTVLGIPLAVLLLAVFTAAVFVSKLIAALTLGKLTFRLFNYRKGWVWPFIAGLAIYELLTLIPIFGWLVACLTILFGLGTLYLERREFADIVRSKKLM